MICPRGGRGIRVMPADSLRSRSASCLYSVPAYHPSLREVTLKSPFVSVTEGPGPTEGACGGCVLEREVRPSLAGGRIACSLFTMLKLPVLLGPGMKGNEPHFREWKTFSSWSQPGLCYAGFLTSWEYQTTDQIGLLDDLHVT